MKQPIKIETVLVLTRLRRYLPDAAASLPASARRCRQVFLALSFLAVSQMAQAVIPPPDGGYPGDNTAEGQNALLSLTTGSFNTAVGWFSLRSNTEGQFNTAVGAGTLLSNTQDGNTATGAGALLSNTTGNANTANGAFALFSNVDGIGNTALGFLALFTHQTGSFNNAVGENALYSDLGGSYNNALGESALKNNIAGTYNTAVGNFALGNSTGDYNIALGAQAGFNHTIGSNNIFIGDRGVGSEANVIAVGATPSSGIAYTKTYIGGIFNAVESGTPVYIGIDGHLGTLTSSRRYKDEIKPMDKASETVFALKPVTFHYKKQIDPTGISQFGLVAEEVEKVDPDLVVRDKEGKAYTVRYDQVNAMLLNEFLKEHKKVRQLEHSVAQQRNRFEATVTELKKEIVDVVARSKDQDEQIEKVRARVELKRAAAPRVAKR